jgi:hypothetical protein
MNMLKNMPASGIIVISIIAALFVLAVILLFYVRLRYRLLEGKASGTNLEAGGSGLLCCRNTRRLTSSTGRM